MFPAETPTQMYPAETSQRQQQPATRAALAAAHGAGSTDGIMRHGQRQRQHAAQTASVATSDTGSAEGTLRRMQRQRHPPRWIAGPLQTRQSLGWNAWRPHLFPQSLTAPLRRRHLPLRLIAKGRQVTASLSTWGGRT